MNAYPNASIYAHLALSTAQAIELAREHDMRLVHTKTGNYQLVTESVANPPVASLPVRRGGGCWKLIGE